MSKLGLVCLWLVLISLIAEFYIAAKLGMRKVEVAEELRKAMAASAASTVAYDDAEAKVVDARQALALVKLGWGFEWVLPGGNPAPVQGNAGKLMVSGLGTNQRLKPLETVDATGQQRIAPPIVHVFKGDEQGGSIYIGEFRADLDQLTADSCVLTPQWNVSAQDLQEWDFRFGSRFRTSIPPGGQTGVENLHLTIQRTREQIFQTGLRIEEQQRLNAAAEAALQGRRNELLGDPNAEANADHPEYSLGLVQALEDLEEERNAVQLAVDQLRRLIKKATESRESLMDSLKQVVSSAQPSAARLSQRPE
jgi:hypothetical protein